MKEEGIERLQSVREHINGIKAEYAEWAEAEAECEFPDDPQNKDIYSSDLRSKLLNVWNTIIKRFDSARATKNFKPLLIDIIFFLDDPKRLELFFGQIDPVQKDVLVLPARLRYRMIQELVRIIDRLFLNCESAAFFFDETEKTSSREMTELYEWLEEVIQNINDYAEERGITQQFNGQDLQAMMEINGSPDTIRSFTDSLASALSMQSYKGAAYPALMRDGLSRLSMYSAAESRYRASERERARAPTPEVENDSLSSAPGTRASSPMNIPNKGIYGRRRTPSKASAVSIRVTLPPTERVVDGEEGTICIHEIVTFVKKPKLSENTRSAMRKGREYQAISLWMRDGYSLDDNLKELVEKHRDKLRDKIACDPEDSHSEQRRRKLEFLQKVIEKSELGILSPKELHELSKYQQDLLFKATGRSHTKKLWLDIRKEIRRQLWERACSITESANGENKPSFFRIIDDILIKRLYAKIIAIPEPDNQVFSQPSDSNSRDKWRHDKRHALSTIESLHKDSKLDPKVFDEIRKKYPDLAGRTFLFLKSATEELINDIREEIEHLLWIEAGGDGDELRAEYIAKQGEKVTPSSPPPKQSDIPTF